VPEIGVGIAGKATNRLLGFAADPLAGRCQIEANKFKKCYFTRGKLARAGEAVQLGFYFVLYFNNLFSIRS